MYMKNLNHKMTLRLTDELYEYVNEMSDKFCMKPSDFIRQCIGQNKDARIMAQRAVDIGIQNALQEGIEKQGGLENGIDRKTYDNNKLQL